MAHAAAASGVAGVNDASGGVGVWGQNTSSAPLAYGVYGIAVNGTGVYGISSGGTGVYGRSSGIGVFGESENVYGFAGFFNGALGVSSLGSAGNQQLCRNLNAALANCSSSLRYKTDVRPFSGGLDIVSRLRPISFAWKQGGMQDVGLAAEDVAQVEPLLTFRNDKGEIEGVKYNQLSAVFVNAIRDQQAQIERQQVQIDALKGLVCQSHPDADVCR
jgi:hypothetical protein